MGKISSSAVKKLAPAMVVLAASLWGSMGLFVRNFNAAGLGSMQISWLRAVSAALIMVPALLIADRKLLRLRLRDLWCFFGTGVLSVVFFNFCYFKNIERSPLSVAAILLYTAPIFVMLMSAVLFRERFTLRKLLALALAFGGCVLVSGIIGSGESIGADSLLLGLGSGFGYALYSIFSRFAIQRGYSALSISAWTFVFAALGGLPLCEPAGVGAYLSGGASALLFTAVYALVTTVAPYLLYTFALEHMENSSASVIASAEPVVATLLGFAVFSERPSPQALFGMLLVLAALALLSFPARGETKSANSDKIVENLEKHSDS